jgi:hypothetical protein
MSNPIFLDALIDADGGDPVGRDPVGNNVPFFGRNAGVAENIKGVLVGLWIWVN